MATHKVVLKPSVEKDLRPLPKSTAARIMKCIAALVDPIVHLGAQCPIVVADPH